MLKQNLQQKLLQKLSPQQIQFIKLLQVPTVALDTRIKEELEENPALEDISLADMNDPIEEYPDKDPDDDFRGEDSGDDLAEFNVDDYLQDDNLNEYGSRYDSNDDEDDKKELPIAINNTFFENLQAQLDLIPLEDKEYLIAQQIIGSLDDNGYLRRPIPSLIDDLAFSQSVLAEDEEAEEMLKVIQNFDPPGVGARDLQECLLIQLRKKDTSLKTIQIAINIVENYLDEFTKKHYDRLEKSLSLTSEELKEVINEILKLNPKPGDSGVSNLKQMQVIPDFHITKNDGVLTLTLNSKNAPELRVSKSYQEMFQHYEKTAEKDKKLKEAVHFVKQKLDSAKWFIDAIKQRQQTLLKTMNAIMHYQYEYFLSDGDERYLKPMILKDIADKIGMDISTVSRVANSKYVQTEFGTYLLKSFFSEAIQTESGEEVSNKEVKKILEECIGNEDKRKPLADEKLTEILKDKGYNIARRTVAKYREQMGIPVARLRKEL
ncbi:RNA polymerase factor sigma-54 [Pedobacter puniceum]|uniref:RNA polymerase factor sigma-54 n=1 Tax=Pedobacter puniceum TaxID=2666136 RepID=A0A7K0FQR2_9SPHI|nr:RNA polymerase factor sigma-54 [Pedobacter puniceum]MRX48294.1 RNA polymerase factor sigma-54 [Pedobacter puniceum]